jgi:hypothetical protein
VGLWGVYEPITFPSFSFLLSNVKLLIQLIQLYPYTCFTLNDIIVPFQRPCNLIIHVDAFKNCSDFATMKWVLGTFLADQFSDLD